MKTVRFMRLEQYPRLALTVKEEPGVFDYRGYHLPMPRGVFIHNVLDYTETLALCENCGWVRRTDKKGRPMCSVARKAHRTSSGSSTRKRRGTGLNRHGRVRGTECAICGSTERLCVDHDHSCCPGQIGCAKCIRGTLCTQCNFAVAYIERALKAGVLDQLIKYASQ